MRYFERDVIAASLIDIKNEAGEEEHYQERAYYYRHSFFKISSCLRHIRFLVDSCDRIASK